MADRVICMMLGSPLTECSVHLFKQSIQSCTLPSARKPVYRALCIVSLKHSAEYSVWSIQSAYYHLHPPVLHYKQKLAFLGIYTLILWFMIIFELKGVFAINHMH